MNTIILTDADAELFKVFLQHHDFIEVILAQAPVMNGTMTLHFDPQGVLKGIKKEFWSYKT